ncbi:MAG: stage II sporulation protein M [Actinomycetota bacterium]|nr:stage II sporulation protein M [Actinomycetota bacterium]
MNIDRFLAENRPTWDRLGALTIGARRRRDLSGAELEELVALYQRTSGHLSHAQVAFPDPSVLSELSVLVSGSSAVIYGARSGRRPAVGTFLTTTFPAAVWHVRRLLLLATALTLGPALAVGLWIANSSAARSSSAPAAVRQAYVNHDFAAYYSSEPASAFATEVYTNNVRVSAEAFASGVAFGIPSALLLVQNGASIGNAGGLFAAAGQQDKFWGLILPHGLIETTSVILAGAAGLRLGATVIDPGDRTRGTALAEEGRRTVVLLIGVVLTLAVAGAIEGFVTGSGLPTVVRVGLGVAVEVAFLAWVGLLGPRAAEAGYSGRLGELADGGASPHRVAESAGRWYVRLP